MTARIAVDRPSTVLLCQDLASLGLDLERLCSSLQSAGAATAAVPGLCDHPGDALRDGRLRGVSRLVLGLCSNQYQEVEWQVQARKLGLDPFGVEVVPLGILSGRVHPAPEATRKALVLLVSAMDRARAFPGSGPEHARPYFLPMGRKISRRSLFTLPPIGYQPVPSIEPERCAAPRCRACLDRCPRQALVASGDHVVVDKARCEGCGVCLAACPREAVLFPSRSLPQFEAQLGSLLEGMSLESPGLLFLCRRALGQLQDLADQGAAYSHRWLPVSVPCLGMVTPSWVLQSLAHGAGSVALLACDPACTLGQQHQIAGRVAFCRRLLDVLGDQSGRVQLLPASQPEALLWRLQELPPPAIRTHAEPGPWVLDSLKGARAALATLSPGNPRVMELEHPCSPFGLVELHLGVCTGCAGCTGACPTGALASENAGDGVTLTFEAALCNGCGQCASICPERALLVRRATNLASLACGRVVLVRQPVAVCRSCGQAIGSQALIEALVARAGNGSPAFRAALTGYCPSCRLSAV